MQKPRTTPSTPPTPGASFRVDRLTGFRWHRNRAHIWRPRIGAVVCVYRTRTTRWGHYAQCDRCGRQLDDLRTLAAEDGSPLAMMPPALVRWIQVRKEGRVPFPRISEGKAGKLFDKFGPPDE